MIPTPRGFKPVEVFHNKKITPWKKGWLDGKGRKEGSRRCVYIVLEGKSFQMGVKGTWKNPSGVSITWVWNFDQDDMNRLICHYCWETGTPPMCETKIRLAKLDVCFWKTNCCSLPENTWWRREQASTNMFFFCFLCVLGWFSVSSSCLIRKLTGFEVVSP